MSALRERHPEPNPAWQLEVAEPVGDVVEVRLEGVLTFADGGELWEGLRARLPSAAQTAVRFDLSAVEGHRRRARWRCWSRPSGISRRPGVRCEFVGGTGAVRKILALYEGDASPTPRPVRPRIGLFGQVGNRTVGALREMQIFLAFVGSMVLAVGGVLRRPRTGNWRDIPPILSRTGADAVPIVVLITFLIGFVMAFQSAVQLKQFGANIFVADLVALSITRELGPLMVAIIVCGRSGAAFAAELGTMKVSEEIDALRTMGVGPLRFLVFPRILVLVLVLPVLTLLGDFVGILGGLVVGVVNLDLTITAYVNQTVRALDLWDVFQGLGQGLRVRPGHRARLVRARAGDHGRRRGRGAADDGLRRHVALLAHPARRRCSR